MRKCITFGSKEELTQELWQYEDCSKCRGYLGKRGAACTQCRCLGVISKYHDELRAYRSTVKQQKSNSRGGSTSSVNGRKLGTLELNEPENDTTEVLVTTLQNAHEVQGMFHMLTSQLRRYTKLQIEKDAASKESELKETLNQECALMRKVAVSHGELLACHDQLRQAKSTLKLWPDNFAKPAGEEDFQIYAWELNERYTASFLRANEFNAELAVAKSNLLFFRNQLTNVSSDDTEVAQCAICMDDLVIKPLPELQRGLDQHALQEAQNVKVTMLMNCSHKFHHLCITEWIKRSQKCPMCKKSANKASLQTCAIDTPKYNHAASESARSQSEIALMKSWGTKVGAIVEDLKVLTSSGNVRNGRETSNDKILVFSQWREMLAIVAAALRSNAIQYEYCFEVRHFQQGGALSRFKSDANIRILLLPLDFGAEGLDLTEANHIFLLEPVANLAVEQQAIGRICRLGQALPMEVHRYVCAGTIEERVNPLTTQGSAQSLRGKRRKDLENISPSQLEVMLSPD